MKPIRKIFNHKAFLPVELVLVALSLVLMIPMFVVLGPYLLVPLVGVLGAVIIELGMLHAKPGERERYMAMIKVTLLIPIVLVLLIYLMLLIISLQV